MYNLRRYHNKIFHPEKTCYIAPRISLEIDDYGNEIPTYGEPKRYEMNIMPAGGGLDIATYGERLSYIYKAIVDYDYYNGKINEGDIAYLHGATPENETSESYGMNGNYVVESVRKQNTVIAIYFERLQK